MAFVYRGLKADYERHIVTPEEIERQIHRLQQQTPRIAVVDNRPTENGDEIVLDYAGFCDGVQFPGGTAQMQTLVLGSGSFIPGFEEQLLDKVVGEEVSVKVVSRPLTSWTTPSHRKWAAARIWSSCVRRWVRACRPSPMSVAKWICRTVCCARPPKLWSLPPLRARSRPKSPSRSRI